MPYGLYISAEGAQAQDTRLRVLANNLANVETPGFKRQLAIIQARYAHATELGLDSPGSRTINDLSGGVEVDRTMTEFSHGPMQQTGTPTDVAVDGPGFFLIDKDGQNYLTRAGNFRVWTDGRLTTQQGYSVLSTDGTPIAIDLEAGEIEISPEGGVFQRRGPYREQVSELALVMPEDLNKLRHEADNLFRFSGEAVALPVRSFAPEFLEQSAVQPTREMVDLIDTTRSFEANVAMIRHQDEMLGSLVNRVLRV